MRPGGGRASGNSDGPAALAKVSGATPAMGPGGISGVGAGLVTAMTQGHDGHPDGAFAGELRDGETLTESFTVGAAAVAVTDRRLLVRDEGTIRAVDRTNVRTVHERVLTNRGRLLSAVQWGGLGAFLLVAWRFAPLEGLVAPVEGPPDAGFEGLYAAVNALVEVLRYVDEAFLVVGLLSFAWTARQLLGYLRERRRVLEVTVAGRDPIRLTVPDDPTATDRLRGAVSARSDEYSE